MMVWPVGAHGGILLVDAGFYRDKFIEQWKPSDFVRPTEVVSAGSASSLKASPTSSSSHVHWDHADGADLFPTHACGSRSDEYDHHIGPTGEPRSRGRPADATMLSRRCRSAVACNS